MNKKGAARKILVILFCALAAAAIIAPFTALAQPIQGPPAPVTPAPAPKTDPAAPECEAGWVACGIREVFGWIIQGILYLFFSLVSILINLAAGLIQILIQISGNVVQSPLVSRGFEITLGLANLGFVLAIIIIAFVTILRLEGYQTKILLRNLIIAAVLVNFSLAIAGIIIDFTNVLSDFFISKASPKNIADFSTNMASSLDVGKLLAVKQDPATIGKLAAGVMSFAAELIGAVISLALGLLVAVLIMIVFFGIALMILARYVYLTILLILMPLAWLFWTIPQLSSYFSKWWHAFLKWTFFLPAVTFFLYLAMAASSGVDALVVTAEQNSLEVKAGNQTTFQDFGGLLQIFIKVALFFGALVAGNAMGIAGASGALAAATGVKNWAIGRVSGAAVGAAKYAGQRPARAAARGASQALAGIKKVPLLGKLVPQRAINALAGLGARKEDVEGLQKDLYSSLSREQLLGAAKGALPLGPARRAAMLAELSKRKLIGDATKDMRPKEKEEFLTKLAEAARQTNPGEKPSDIPAIKDIITASPSLAAKLTAARNPDGVTWTDEEKSKDAQGNLIQFSEEDIIAKFAPKINASEAFKLPKSELENREVAINLTRSAIANIYRNGTQEKIDALKKTLQATVPENLRETADKIAELRESIRLAKDTKSPDLVTLQEQLRDVVAEKKRIYDIMASTQKAAYDRLEFLAQKMGADSD